jgi:hypothetical protein
MDKYLKKKIIVKNDTIIFNKKSNDLIPIENDLIPIENDLIPIENDLIPIENDLIPIENDLICNEYIKSFSLKESKAYEITKSSQLKEFFTLSKSHGFKEWCISNK